MRSFALMFMLASTTALVACGDEGKRPLGDECTSDAQCESGICGGSVCLDPEGDDDLDGLTNSVEADLGSSPVDRDTDADGIPDGDEVDQVVNIDTDGDGKADIVESATLDEDDDCIPDQYDARNETPDSDLSPMIDIVCSEAGVCAGQRGVMQVECSTGTARCVYGSVPGYANPETACDGIDQNCDGVADDGLPDRDGDAIADCVDVDWDNDSVTDDSDNCPTVANPDQADGDGDGIGNACVTSYALEFLESPTTVTAGVAFGARVGVTFLGSDDDAPRPRFDGEVTLTLAGDASLSGTTTRGVEDGVANFADLVVEVAARGLVLVASSGDLSGARSDAFESVAGVASQFTFDALPETAVAGTPLGFELVARDANGNVIDDYTGTVTFSSSDARAALPGAYTFLAGDNGRHAFGGIVLETAGAQTIIATDGDITSDGAVTISPAALRGLRIEASDKAVSGATDVFEVIAEDRFGNTVTTYAETIALETTDEGADLPATIAASIATPGRYSGTLQSGFVGEHVLTASAGELVTTHTYTVAPGEAASLELSAPATIGAAVAFDATVTLRDGFGNVATGFAGTVTLASDDAAAGAMPAPHTFVGIDEGVFVFEGVTLATARTTTLRASSGAFSDQLDIEVVAGDAASLTIVTAPASVVAGQAFSITAEFRDAAGNLASETTRNVIVSGEDMELRNLDATGASVIISNVVLTKASAATTVVVASPTFGLSDSVEIAVTPGPATKLTVTGPAAATAGDAFDLTVSARDQYDNLAPDYRGVVRFTTNDPATDPAALVPDDYTFTEADAGTHTFVGGVTLYTASDSPLRVTVTDLTPIAAPSAVLDVSIGGGAATRLVLTGPANAVAGTPFEVTATVYDDNGNLASGYTGTVTLTTPAVPNRPAATLPAAYTFTTTDGGRHVFTGADRVTLFAAGAIVVTATDATPLTEAVSTLTVDVAPAAAAGLSVTSNATGNPVAGAPFGITVSALDLYGNVATSYLGRVVFTSNDPHTAPAPVLPAPYTFVAADAGVHVFTPVTLYTAGARTLTATDETPIVNPAGVLAITIDPGVASKVRFVEQPTDGVAGVAFSPAVSAEVADAFDNRVASTATIDIGVATNPGRAVAVDGQVAALAGLAEFPTLSLDRPGLGYVLSATATGLSAGLSDAFDLAWQAPTVTAPTLSAQGNCVTVGYSASHNLSRPIDVIVEYDLVNDSPDAGWRTATQCGDDPQAMVGGAGVNGLVLTATAAPYTFNWNALKDLGSFDAAAVSVRVTTRIGEVATTSAATAYTYDASWTGTWTPSNYSGAIVNSTVGDVDNDGTLDLVTVEANTNNVYWARGDGSGRFGAAQAFNVDVPGLNVGSVVVADTHSRWSGSGMNDIIVADRNADRAVILQIGINPDSGQAHLSSFDTIDDICGGSGPWITDIEVSPNGNGDDALNLFFACSTARKVARYFWTGQMWQAQTAINTGAYGAPRSLARADFDWDGRADLAIGLATGGVLLYGAPISVDYEPFFQIANATGVKAVIDIAVGDLDRDGLLDLAFIDDETTARRAYVVFGAVVRDGQGVVTRFVDPATMVPVPTTGLPTQLELGDLDRDGLLDLALAFLANDSVAVLRSNAWRTGVTTADAITTGATTDGPNSLSLADLNHDGYPDLALSRRSTASTQRIGAILGTPRADCDDAFSGAGDGATYALPMTSTTVADVDRDGHTDLVHGLGQGNGGGAAITYGRGNGRFAADDALVFTAATTTDEVALGDLDGDGDLDLAAIDAGRVVIFRQGGRYTWTAATGLSTLPNATRDLKVADVDLDRRDDLVWIETNGQTNDSVMHVWLQSAAGVFSAASFSPIALGDGAEGIALADLDVDGVLDVAFTSYRGGSQTVSLCALRSNGTRAWPAVSDADCSALTGLFLERFVGFADVDADPEVELVLVLTGANQTPTIQIRSASDTGLFDQVEDDASSRTQPDGYQRCFGQDVAFGTYGSDGAFGLDMALRCSGTPFVTVFGRTPTGFENGTRLAYGQPLYRGSLAFGDFNGDHRDDVVTGATVILQGEVPTLYDYGAPDGSSEGATMADFDGNGFPDVAAFPGSQSALDITRQGVAQGGVFVKPVQSVLDTDPWGSPRAGDFDGDGRPDLASYYLQDAYNQGVLLLHQNEVDGTSFGESVYNVADGGFSVTYTEPTVGDFDANGLDDVAIAVRDANSQILVWFLRQTWPGQFSPHYGNLAAREVSAIASGRLRKPDANFGQTQAVALAGTCGEPARTCIVIVNDTGCDFAQCDVSELFPKNTDRIDAIAVGDLNKDGLDDIAVVQSAEDGYPTIFLQSAAGTFAEVFFAGAATPMYRGRAETIAIVDINGDGWGDLVSRTASYSGDANASTVEIFVNERTTPLGLSIANRYESFGYRANTLLIGDLVRTGQIALGATYAGTNQLIIKK